MYRTRNWKYYQHEDAYPHLRRILSEDYAYLSEEQLEDSLEPMLGDMSLEEYEDFLRDISRFGKQAGNVLSRAAPGALSGAMQGATAGAALGPYGMLAGALGGAALGGFQSYQASRQPRPVQAQASPQQAPTQTAPTPTPSPAATTAPTAAPVTTPYPSSPAQATTSPALPAQSGSASAQLLSVLTRPETLQALLSMVMAQSGRRDIQVGGTQVPVAAFANLISTLAQRSAVQQNALVANTVQGTPEYLMNEFGEFICDPMDAEQRADVLLTLLNEDICLDESDEDDDEDDEFYDDNEDVYAMDNEDEEDIFWEDEVEAILAG